MILPKALMLGVSVLLTTLPAAAAGNVPELNIEQVCRGIAEQGGVTFRDPAIAVEKKSCLDSEKSVREQLIKEWSNFTESDKTSCVTEARMGGDSSYTELLTCLEMARDVRALRAQHEAPDSPDQQPAVSSERTR
jgi:hypothetical protein